MPNSVASFIICTILGFGIGFAGYEIAGKEDASSSAKPAETESAPAQAAESSKQEPEANESTQPETVSASSEVFTAKGCLGCHSVSSLNLQGGATGPDLSKAFTNVEDKHGKPLDEFMKAPTSAVMSGVISGSPLSDEEVQQVVDALKEASEK
jgi:mono/diheme cytochrome c family protein